MGRVKPWDLETVRDPTTFVSALMQFDRQRGDYFATIGRDVVRAERMSDLRPKLVAALRLGFGMAWERSIVIERAEAPVFRARAIKADGFYASVSIGIVRGEIAIRSDGLSLFRGWPQEDIDDDLPEGLNPPDTRIVSVLPGHVFTRPYSDASWRAVTSTAVAMHRASVLLETAENVDQICRAVDLRSLLAEIRAANAGPKEE